MFEIELIKRWESEDMTKIHLDDSNTEAATRGVLQKKVFLKISQNSQENTCDIVSF